ncbi:MAG: glycosyltransferase [Acidimicrobiia bacterium]|nr:glycosyltransferase family 2 protein [Acidimicrobiia bacterium]NNF11460.1 glycosyltransferase [Acidimicrobiia bacterium]NNL71312.1 glycosyltransferase [Acidimicrobiia bacterium]
MLRLLLLVSQVLVAALAGYNLFVALWGLRDQAVIRRGQRKRRVRVVIPAHNEAAVIGTLLADLAAQTYPADLTRVVVLADRCTDGTVAAAASVEVAERSSGPDGKGPAIAWYLAEQPLAPDESLVILDADNQIPPDFLAGMVDALDNGFDAAQAYVDSSNPDESWLATASALSYWASSRMVQLARHNLGWTPDLGGTGTAFAPTATWVLGTPSGVLTEDSEQAARLAQSGHRIGWLHTVRVYDQKPVSMSVAMKQRARWMSGKRSVARSHRLGLISQAVRRRSWGLIDLVIRQSQPGRTFMVGIAVLLAVFSLFTDLLWPWWVWGGLALIQVLAPLVFLMRDRVPARYLWRYPLLAVFGLVWVPVRLMSARVRGWYHTPHA